MAANVVPFLTGEDRARIEDRLGAGVAVSVYVNNAARVTVEVRLPEGVSDADAASLGPDVERAARELAQAVDLLVPAAAAPAEYQGRHRSDSQAEG